MTFKTVRADFLAGLTGAVIVIPQGVAFAIIAGLPPIYGLYTAMVTPIVAALFGSSYHLISGPTTAISLVIFGAISEFAEPGSSQFIGLALTITLMAGLIQLLLGISRFGALVNFVSHSVIIGFTAGAAILIATSQINLMVGISLPRGLDFYEVWEMLFRNIDKINIYAIGITVVTLMSAIILRRISRRIPHLLLSMVIGSLVTWVVGAEKFGIELLGEMPSGLPPISLSLLSFESFRDLAPNAFAIALLGLIEAVAIGKGIATKTQQRIDSNQEFIGQGLSNIVGSFFSSYAGSGSFTRTGVNHQAGAKTPMAAVFAALILMVLIVFVAKLTAYLPIPAMGGIILIVAWRLIDFYHIKRIVRASKREIIVVTITFVSTLVLDLQFAIYFGVFFSLVLYLRETSQPSIVERVPNPESKRRAFSGARKNNLDQCPQLKIIRIDGSLFFGAIDHVGSELQYYSKGRERKLLLICSGINLIDVAGAELLVSEANRLREIGRDIYLCGLKDNVRRFLEKGKYLNEIGLDHIFDSKQEAIATLFTMLDADICRDCSVRIFTECHTALAN